MRVHGPVQVRTARCAVEVRSGVRGCFHDPLVRARAPTSLTAAL